MYAAKRPLMQPVIIFLILVSFVLAACGARLTNQTWPGMSAEDGVVYVAYGPGVLAVDVNERRQLWTFPEEASQGLAFYAAPSVEGNHIVLGDFGASGGVFSPGVTVTIYRLEGSDTAPGDVPQVVWARDDFAHDKIVAPPTQADRQVFVGTSDNHLLALDSETGDLQWDFETEHSIWAQPVYQDGTVYVASLDNFVYALDAASGELLWEAQMGGSIGSAPVLDSDLLYIPSFDRALHAVNSETGEEVWMAEAESWVWGSPAVGNGTVYYADIEGNVYAVDALTGESRWQVSDIEGSIQSALLYVDGVLFVGAGDVEGDEETRVGRLVALDGESGDVLWQQQTPAPVFSSPVQIDDSVVVAVQDSGNLTLLQYDMESGALIWDFAPPTGE